MRLFVAINFSPELRGVLEKAIENLSAQAVSGSFTPRENLHLTLAFIGETGDLQGAKAALDELSASPFPLALSGFGRFGDLHWAGVWASGPLQDLAEAVQNALRRRGFDIEKRPFKPHITLARRVVSEKMTEIGLCEASMTVSRVSLMRSDRIGGRLVYTEIYARNL